MKSLLFCFLSAALAAIGLGATNPADTPTPPTAHELAQGFREHFILARPRASHRATIDADEAREHVRVREKFSRFGDLRVIALDNADNAKAAIARLRATGRYDFVEPDYIRTVQATPNDPRYLDGSMWALNNTGQSGGVIGVAGADIKAVAAWDIIHNAPNVIVAVVDTGINLSHQDIAPNLWTNPSPTRNDLHGANFVGGNGKLVGGDPSDDEGHGTHVAGTIGAVGNNGIASTGIAWKVQIMAVKVLSSDGTGTVSDIVGGINYAISHGAQIINASYGSDTSTGYSQSELNAITAARNSGVIFVAAAGNSAANLDVSRSYPASFPLDNMVTVGASNRRDEVSSFSNYGAAVDLFAPGEEIVSLNYASPTGTISYSGTSMAAPHVSGALALLRAEFPADTYRQLINRLLRGADRGDRFIGKAQTGGRLNLLRALSPTAPNTPFNDRFADRPHFSTDNLTIRANNAGATAELTDPPIAGVAPAATLWWEWTAPASGRVSVDTSGSSYNTLLAVYTGNAAGALSLVASNDDDLTTTTSRLTFNAQAGTTYQLEVDGKNGASGLTMLNLGTTPANDAFASPVTLNGESAHITATNLHASREAGEPTILGFAGGNSLWYQWTAPRNGHFQISASSVDFDPILAVYTGTSLESLTLVSASDNTGPDNAQTGSLCSIDATAGTTYRITIDSKTSSTIGQFTLSIVDSLWQATTGDAVTATPAVASDGTIYVGSTDGSMYAYGPDGAQKWAYVTGGFIDTASAAIGDDGTVYFGSADGTFYAVAPDGTLRWKRAFGSTYQAGFSPAIAADGTIYTRATDAKLHALNPADGSDRWTATIQSVDGAFYGNPVVAPDGTIYQGTDESLNTLYAFNPDGSTKWTLTVDSGVYGAPAIDAAGNLYLSTLTGGVYCIAPDKTQRWHVTSAGDISSSVALSADGKTLYYAGYDAMLYARDTATGAVKWTYPLGAEVRASSPAIDANGVIYIGCYDDILYAINPDGTKNRQYDTGNIVRSSPVIAGQRLYVGSNDQKLYAFDLAAGVASGPWPQYRANARHLGRALADSLSIVTQPASQTAIVGGTLTLSVVASGQSPLSYQWQKDGATIAGATSASYTVTNVTTGAAGTYTVTVSGPQGSMTSGAATVTVTQANPGRLMNVSVRTIAGNDDKKLIVGFALKGSAPKPLLVRGIGPTLQTFGVSGTLAAPELNVLVQSTGAIIASNTVWGGSPTLTAAFHSVGAFDLPATSKDDALITNLPVRDGAIVSYSMQITGANNTTGTALAEVYDLDPSDSIPPARLVNVSARAQVGTGPDVLIAGFNISGNVPKKLLIRGIGPGLAQFGVGGYLLNPKLEIYDAQNVIQASNDDWGADASVVVGDITAFESVGAFGLSSTSRDAALVITLQPGSYTAKVSGVNDTTGVGLVEVYELP